MKSDLRIVFMGTPDFAVASLRALIEGGYQVVAVVTVPDKPAGRGQQMHASAVKQYAMEQHLPVLQPEKLKDEQFLTELRAFKPDLQVVVAFRMLPEVVWQWPRYGTLNVHASLLPQYRGAAPINWAIMRGETVTGVTTFFIDKEIDTGRVIDRRKVSIFPEDTAGTLHDKLMVEGASLLTDTVDQIVLGQVKALNQEDLQECISLQPAPKIFRDTCRIDWTRDTQSVYNLIRGLSPYPAAWTQVVTPRGQNLILKIYSAGITDSTSFIPNKKPENLKTLLPGTFLTDQKSNIWVGTSDGVICIRELQLEGKKRMSADAFLRGIPDFASYIIKY